jgi:hypothetical protein
MQTSSSPGDRVTFSDVRAAFTALESSLRALPNPHRLHCEGNLMMVSHAFVSEDEFRAFAFSGPSWDRVRLIKALRRDGASPCRA